MERNRRAKPFACPECGSPVVLEVWAAIHFAVDAETGRITTTRRKVDDPGCWAQDDVNTALICKNPACGKVHGVKVDMDAESVTAITDHVNGLERPD